MTFNELKLELQKRCLDLGQGKRPDARYGEVLNQQLGRFPRSLWGLIIDDTTLDTVANVREYVIWGITGLTQPNQVRRVWIDDSSGVPRETGRLDVRGAGVTLSIVLDFNPQAGRDIGIEYWVTPAEMVLADDVNPVDDEWLLAKAMVALMGEADWEIEDPNEVTILTEYWNAQAVDREDQLLGQRRHISRKPRTTDWREYVT